MQANHLQTIFSTSSIDRMAHLRLDTVNHQPSSDQYILISQNNVLINNDDNYFFQTNTLPKELSDESLSIFLGGDEKGHYFALPVAPEMAENYHIIPLRQFLINSSVPKEKIGLFAEANSLLNWHQRNSFCPRCGTKTEAKESGWRRDCPACETTHFPRTDPVVIMLVTNGDHCLLGRSPHFPEKLISCLAGFIEPGETIEQAALRELKEEVGIDAEEVKYLSNQPWPFTSNLMIGVHIESSTTEINIDPVEIESARWMSKSELKSALKDETNLAFALPPKIAIARNLLEHWANS